MESDFLLYGANGFVGREIARMAAAQGLRPLLAGRNAEAVQQLAAELRLEYRIFSLKDANLLEAALQNVPLVLHCAGPYINTYEAVLTGCLKTSTHYLDITGEQDVYQAIFENNETAQKAGIMLLPGAGFDVVPTDCLAAHLKKRLPSANRLTLAFNNRGRGGMPPGTAKTVIEMFSRSSSRMHRVDGRLVTALERKSRQIDFGRGPVEAYLFSWGDIYMAYHSTGIPNIEDYITLPGSLIRVLDLAEMLKPVLRLSLFRRLTRMGIPTGSTAEQRKRSRVSVWGEVVDDHGNTAVSRMHGPEAGVVWTGRAALAAVKKVLEGQFTPGFQTPATAYGPDFALECEGVVREDVV